MRKFTQQTAARLFVTLAILAAVGIVASEYVRRNPPEPGTLLGQVWQIVAQ